jgi:hypothetical protein
MHNELETGRANSPGLPQGPRYRAIEGWPHHRVGDDGSAWSCLDNRGRPTGRWHRLRPRPNADGYLNLGLPICKSVHGRRGVVNRGMHRIVLVAFVGPCPPGMECRHLDNNRANNRLDNLCWGTKAEQSADAVRHGTNFHRARGTKVGSSKLTESQVLEIRARYMPGTVRMKDLATEFRVSQVLISQIVRRRIWTHV